MRRPRCSSPIRLPVLAVGFAILALAPPTAAVRGRIAAAEPAAAAPVIVWASSPVRPDETVAIAGHALATPGGPPPRVDLAPLENAPPGPPPSGPEPDQATVHSSAKWQPQPTVRSDAEGVAAVIPAAWPQAIWACRVSRGDAASQAVLLNAATPWWLQGDQGESATPGGTVRVFGVALEFDKTGQPPSAALRSDDGGIVPLEVTEATSYALSLRIPPDAKPGRHRLWIHNGLGGPAGWRLAGQLDIAAPRTWKTDRFNVRDFGPKPEEAILAALAKAKENGGGVVYLPRGRYGLTKPLDIPDGVVLAGESRELVSIFWPDFETPPLHLVRGTTFGLENLSLYCQNHRSVVVIEPKSDGTFIRNCRIRANCHFMIERPGEPFRDRSGPKSNRDIGAGIAMHGKNFEIRDCDVLASDIALFVRDTRQGRVVGNTFLYGGRGYRIESSR